MHQITPHAYPFRALLPHLCIHPHGAFPPAHVCCELTPNSATPGPALVLGRWWASVVALSGVQFRVQPNPSTRC